MEEIKKIMLGHLADNIEVVVITPLKSTFHSLRCELNVEKLYDKAFFENCIFRIGKKNTKGLLILSPQGIGAKDVIELFKNTNILFFGLAGSLKPKLEIGSFVEVKSTVNEKGGVTEVYAGKNFENVTCGYSPCLLGKIAKEYYSLAKSLNCDVVDMETVYCAETAIEGNNIFASLLLISDIPEVTNFWQVSELEQRRIKDGRTKAINEIKKYINLLIGVDNNERGIIDQVYRNNE